MIFRELNLEREQVHKLLSAASADAALLYIYMQSGNDPDKAETELSMTHTRYAAAEATLRQLGLWPEPAKKFLPVGQRPLYSEQDVIRAVDTDMDFKALYGEVQRILGRNMNTEELKILLGFVRYLGLPADVVSLLIHYCRERARQRGSTRNPSLRTIEKEAYAWSEQGIDSMEAAAAYMQRQNVRMSRLGRLMHILQIRGRNLTPGEEKYAQQWLDWGFEDEAISMAYERTCLNTGGLSWAYMNKILTRWQQAGLLTADAIKSGDVKNAPKGERRPDEDELAAMTRLLQGG